MQSLDAIGGYFELELRRGGSFHPTAFALNSARHCLEYILRVKKYTKLYIPYYTCSVILQPLERLGVTWERYALNEKLEPQEVLTLASSEAILYTNYFGLKQPAIARLAEQYGNQLIVDNAQAFYDLPMPGIDTFYSPRKFFGVPDGGYLYTQRGTVAPLEQDVSVDRMAHLLKRIDLGSEHGYADFRSNNEMLSSVPMRRMSRLTEMLLNNIDYEAAAVSRRRNFEYLHTALSNSNGFPVFYESTMVPMVYPYWTEDCSLRQKLISSKVFVATYWPGVSLVNDVPPLEKHLEQALIPLPIDQRYSLPDMKRIVNLIKN